MDGRDAEGLRPFLDLALEMGDPDLEHSEECPRCGYDTVLTFPATLMSPLGVYALPPTKACMRCFDETEDLTLSIVSEAHCPECVQGKHPNCTGQALDADDELGPCACADAGHPA